MSEIGLPIKRASICLAVRPNASGFRFALGEKVRGLCQGMLVPPGGFQEKAGARQLKDSAERHFRNSLETGTWESMKECARDELSEEFGLYCGLHDIHRVAIITFRNGEKNGQRFDCECHVFLMKRFRGTLQAKEKNPGIISPAWFDRRNLPEEKIPRADREWLPQIYEGMKLRGDVEYLPGSFTEYARPPIWTPVQEFEEDVLDAYMT